METIARQSVPSFSKLKVKHRRLRDGFPVNLSLRVHRALSWLQRAEKEEGDTDLSFVLHWIAFNAAYAEDIQGTGTNERSCFEGFFDRIVGLDAAHRIYDATWQRFAGPMRVLIENQYVFQPFWNHRNGIAGYEDWEDRLARSRRRIQAALADRDTKMILCTVFDRLYVLRNQLVHGGATWNGGVNRGQVRDGARIMAFLVPIFIDLMMDGPDLPWGPVHYPVLEE